MKNLLLSALVLIFLSSLYLSADNNIQAVKIKYQVFNPVSGDFDLEIPAKDNFELLPENPKYGKIRPVAIFKNVTPDKELQFYYSIKITNDNEKSVLINQTGWVNTYRLANPQLSGIEYIDENEQPLTFPTSKYKTGLPPGGLVKIYFNEFIPADSLKNNHGTLTVSIFSNDLSYPDIKNYPNEDVSDDTIKVILNSLLISENYSFDESNKFNGAPSPYNWINKGAEIVDGNVFCNQAINSVSVIYDSISQKISVTKRFSPVYRLNRLDASGKDESGLTSGGDTMTSQILDLRGRYGTLFSFLAERSGKINFNFPRGWSDSIMTGPEHRVCSSSDSTIEIRKPDELIFEYIFADSIEQLVNPDESLWTNHPRRNGAPAVTDNPAYTLFGGGGSRVGFLETDKDSALTYAEGLRVNIKDIGKDPLFTSSGFGIPNSAINGKGMMRFRIRVNANDNSINGVTKDDADDFFLDKIHLDIPCECSDAGICGIRISSPYSIIPYKDSLQIPVSVFVYTPRNSDFPSFGVYLRIKHEDQKDWQMPDICTKSPLQSHAHNTAGHADNICIYCGRVYSLYEDPYSRIGLLKYIPGFNQRQEVIMPPIYLSNFKQYLHKGINKFEALGLLLLPGGDTYNNNDTLYSEFSVNIGDDYAYDTPEGKNDVPAFSGIYNRGLNMFALSSGDYSDDAAFGVNGGSGSGEIAMKFVLTTTDTIYGFKSWFENHGLCNDISFDLRENNNGMPGKTISNSIMYKTRGMDDIKNQSILSDYSTYLYNKPIILNPGTYWASVIQLGDNGFEFGGSAGRAGLITLVVDSLYNGNWNSSIIMDNSLQIAKNDSTVNYCHFQSDTLFYYMNTGRDWTKFTPDKGNPAFTHHDRYGTISQTPGAGKTFSRGTFLPMLRLFVNYPDYNWSSVSNESLNSNELIVSPNPASDFITIAVPSEAHTLKGVVEGVRLYDVFGQEEHPPTPSYKEGEVRIDVSALPAGVYFVRVGDKVNKFVKI